METVIRDDDRCLRKLQREPVKEEDVSSVVHDLMLRPGVQDLELAVPVNRSTFSHLSELQ